MHSSVVFADVIKRSGEREPFDLAKLQASIRAALHSAKVTHNPLDGIVAQEAVSLLASQVVPSGAPTTSQIRDAVQAILMGREQYDATKSYLLFRYLPKVMTTVPIFGNSDAAASGTLFPLPTRARKRDGQAVAFEKEKITTAIYKAGLETGKIDLETAGRLADIVVRRLAQTYVSDVPSVEQIQDMVEIVLMREGFLETAKAYILYRNKRSEFRKARREIPQHVKQLADESKKYFRNSLAEFIYYRTYSRWIPDEGRRETWIETVDRHVNFMKENMGDFLTAEEYREIREGILRQEAMPSMRLLQFSGPAARKTHVCAYNCSYIAPSNFQDFGEIMYVSMCGTGVGFSVESKNIQGLPQIKKQIDEKLPVYVVPDDKEGWSDALVYGMRTWFEGRDVEFDYSLIRPAGARLRTMGGRSSGPEPLRALLDFTREKILRKQGRRLSNIDVHDIICKIGEVVVAGGVRRSALISLSDLDDVEMRNAKTGQFYLNEPQRSMANNSAVYEQKPSAEEFMDEWISLMKSGTGERGIFNRVGLAKTLPKRRLEHLRGYIGNLGTNPCGEIVLQSKQFCNLSEVVARAEDTQATLLRKVRLATILGTYQATLTNFGYLSPEWRRNCESERLLGVSITGQWDCPVVRDPQVLDALREEAIKVNREYAQRMGVNASTCITTVKPSGNLSQTVDCASGMHPRHCQYYIRRVRISHSDSLFKMLRDQKIPFYPEVGQSQDSATTYVVEFPIKAPDGAVFKDDVSALQQLEHWKMVKLHYTEHNPSVTISIGEEEWIAVAHWLYEHWDILGGLSFLPRTKHAYRLAPYEAITKERYEQVMATFPELDFSQILIYEKEDETAQAVELACAGGACEIDYIAQSVVHVESETNMQEDTNGVSTVRVESRETEQAEISFIRREGANEPARSTGEADIDEFTTALREKVKEALG